MSTHRHRLAKQERLPFGRIVEIRWRSGFVGPSPYFSPAVCCGRRCTKPSEKYGLAQVHRVKACLEAEAHVAPMRAEGFSDREIFDVAGVAAGRAFFSKLVEGLGALHGGCHPLQDAFDRWNAAQCGFCTPGILMSAEALIRNAGSEVNSDQVCAALSGNLCRCTGYQQIFEAVEEAIIRLAESNRDSVEIAR